MIPDDPAAAAAGSAGLSAWVAGVHQQTPVAGILVPATRQAVDKQVESAAMADISRGAVAATRFRIEKGRLPASWDELTQAKLISAVPIDPFDGKSMRFAVHGDYVFIYTIGRNGIDHGGAPYMSNGGPVKWSNPGMIISDRPLWELDLLPKGFVPATQESQ